MTEENNEGTFDIEAPGDPEEVVRTIGETMEVLLDSAGVDKVYGSPIERGEYTIIPAAEVVVGAGFGIGYGSGEAPGGGEDQPVNRGGGGGGGGGGRTFTRPVAVVIAGPEGVRVEPVMDVTKVALAALTGFGFMISTLNRMKQGKIQEE